MKIGDRVRLRTENRFEGKRGTIVGVGKFASPECGIIYRVKIDDPDIILMYPGQQQEDFFFTRSQMEVIHEDR